MAISNRFFITVIGFMMVIFLMAFIIITYSFVEKSKGTLVLNMNDWECSKNHQESTAISMNMVCDEWRKK